MSSGPHLWVMLQEMRRQMMPPIVNSLGPITDWLSSRRIGSLSAKYKGSSRASSAAKVHRQSHNVPVMNGYSALAHG